MPIALLIILSVIALFVCCIIVTNSEYYFPWKTIILMIFIVAGNIVWWSLAWDQDVGKENYYYLVEEKEHSGVIKQKLYTDTEHLINMNAHFDCVLPPETIIKVWRYNKYKNGINWMNGGNRHELILPSDIRHEEAKKKVKVIFNVIDE